MSVNTPCIRCGKTRIVGKIWTENVSGSKITHTQTVCPDPECQKIVEEELARKMEKVKDIQAKSLERRKMVKRVKKTK
ncbi:hypothetical protein A2W14_05935 [Candidatus Gottesmanbacteria bacterium RBG_16_37_8]|uniref:Uncharacterized protein n=1 Tax=Candidatus Gottesmanbacteria bacterium RBG_16_37_8 TaxID=1798371 RepID=A0A1F5YVP7_9BACT|nr:MAG: hypothetical protein A2W14_05935 [Candidatus Gottesmanbacteria bacterium RBG_16_37_8]